MLALADMQDLTEEKVKEELERYYSGDGVDQKEVHDFLLEADILIAYESTGSYGCDSASFFLIRKGKIRHTYYTVLGSHCSCSGFEGQFKPDKVSLEYLKSKQFKMWTGGYDDEANGNEEAVKKFIQELEE